MPILLNGSILIDLQQINEFCFQAQAILNTKYVKNNATGTFCHSYCTVLL